MNLLDKSGKLIIDLETLTFREYLKLLAQRQKELKPSETRQEAIRERREDLEAQFHNEEQTWYELAYPYCVLFQKATQYAVLKKTQLGLLINEFEKLGYELHKTFYQEVILNKKIDLGFAQWAPISDPIYAPDRSTVKPTNVTAKIIIENSDKKKFTQHLFELFDNNGDLIGDLSYTLSMESYFNTEGLTKTEIAVRRHHEAKLRFQDDPEAYTIEGTIEKEEITPENITLLRAIMEEPFRQIFTGKEPVYFGSDVHEKNGYTL